MFCLQSNFTRLRSQSMSELANFEQLDPGVRLKQPGIVQQKQTPSKGHDVLLIC